MPLPTSHVVIVPSSPTSGHRTLELVWTHLAGTCRPPGCGCARIRQHTRQPEQAISTMTPVGSPGPNVGSVVVLILESPMTTRAMKSGAADSLQRLRDELRSVVHSKHLRPPARDANTCFRGLVDFDCIWCVMTNLAVTRLTLERRSGLSGRPGLPTYMRDPAAVTGAFVHRRRRAANVDVQSAV